MILTKISDFEKAYLWKAKSKVNHPPNSDIWGFLRSFEKIKHTLRDEFNEGKYALEVQKQINLKGSDKVNIWNSKDSVILKILAGKVESYLKPYLSKSVFNLKGKGGVKGALKCARKNIKNYKFFYKTDVKSYYASISHVKLQLKLAEVINNKMVLTYVWNYLRRSVEVDGIYKDIKVGIGRGCSLSPVVGSFYLSSLDKLMDDLDIKYIRFMDDILILSKTRWKLRKAIKVLRQEVSNLDLKLSYEKTQVGRIEEGFDFLGFRITPEGIIPSRKTINSFLLKVYQICKKEFSLQNFKARLEKYFNHWKQWVVMMLC